MFRAGQNARSKNRVLDIKKEYPVLSQCPMDVSEYGLDVFDVVQGQIGDHAVPGVLRVFVFFNAADTVFDLTFPAAFFRLRDHFGAQVKSQYPYRAPLRRESAMPAVPAAQIKDARSLKRRKQGL